MKAADEIFQEKSYSTFIQNLQDNDKKDSFQDPSLPDWYSLGKEPNCQTGLKSSIMYKCGLGYVRSGQAKSGHVRYLL
jgi:hypothetical protein